MRSLIQAAATVRLITALSAALSVAGRVDEHGFPVDEYHHFGLRTDAAAAAQDAVAGGPHGSRTFEYRLSLAAYSVRWPGYDGAGRY